MAGPWFTVRESPSDWQPFGDAWISDGGGLDGAATLEYRLKFTDLDDIPLYTEVASHADSHH